MQRERKEKFLSMHPLPVPSFICKLITSYIVALYDIHHKTYVRMQFFFNEEKPKYKW